MTSPSFSKSQVLSVVLAAAIFIGNILVDTGYRGSPQRMTQAAPETTLFPSPPVLTLKVVPLSSPAPAIIMPASSSSEDNAYAHLYTVMDKYASGNTLRLLDSYESTSTWDDGDIAWVYDLSLIHI